MKPRIRCKECGCIWEYSELNERGEDGFFECPKCGESLYNARIEKPDDLDADLIDLLLPLEGLHKWDPKEI